MLLDELDPVAVRNLQDRTVNLMSTPKIYEFPNFLCGTCGLMILVSVPHVLPWVHLYCTQCKTTTTRILRESV